MGSGVTISSLKMAGVVVAVVEFLLCILSVYGLFRNFHLFGSNYLFWFVLGILSVIVIIFAIVLMLYAIKKEKARWLIPHLSAQRILYHERPIKFVSYSGLRRSVCRVFAYGVFLIIFLIIVAIVVTILLLFSAYQGIRNLLGVYDYHMSDDSTFIIGIMIIVIYLIVALLEMFFLIIIWKLYKHLRDYSSIGHWTDEKNVQWQNVGPPPKDNAHGSPTMGDVYPYGQEQEQIL